MSLCVCGDIHPPEGGGGEGGNPAGKMKLIFFQNQSSYLDIQAHFLDFLGKACWYWPELAII